MYLAAYLKVFALENVTKLSSYLQFILFDHMTTLEHMTTM